MEIKLKVGHQGDHVRFLNLDITIKCETFIYKLYHKRDSFPFSAFLMPHKESNIRQNIFYSAIKGEFLKIACSTLCLRDFSSKAKELLERIRTSWNHGYFLTKNNIISSTKFPALLFLIAGPPEPFFRKYSDEV